MKNFLLMASFSMLPSVAFAQIQPADVSPSTVKPSDKVICKAADTIGSRLQTSKRCLTAAQWRQLSRDGVDDVDNRLRTVHDEAAGG